MAARITLLAVGLVACATPLLAVPLQEGAERGGAKVGPEFTLSKKGPEVKVDAAPETNFALYKTFGWSETQEPVPNPANHIRISRAIERELRAKGLKPSGSAPPDLRLHYFGYIDKKIKGTSRRQETYQPTADIRTIVDFSRVKEGTLILELFERTTGRLLWRAVATEAVGPPDETEAQIDRMVKALVERYPSKR
jgi:Domain of unknown function (DUF4136)